MSENCAEMTARNEGLVWTLFVYIHKHHLRCGIILYVHLWVCCVLFARRKLVGVPCRKNGNHAKFSVVVLLKSVFSRERGNMDLHEHKTTKYPVFTMTVNENNADYSTDCDLICYYYYCRRRYHYYILAALATQVLYHDEHSISIRHTITPPWNCFETTSLYSSLHINNYIIRLNVLR